jgi:signal transduction histidine kinase
VVRDSPQRWRIGRRLVFVVAMAAAGPSLAIGYWAVRWLADGLPLLQAIALVAGWTTLVTAVATMYGVVAARRLVGPLEAMTASLRSFDPSLGDVGHPALIDGASEPDEVARLKQALRGAVERIGRDRSQKEAVLAGLMHDLKTPLVAQTLLLDRLPTLSGSARDDALNQLRRASRGAAARLNRLIDVLRVDAVDGRISRCSCDVRDLVDDVVTDLAELAASRGVKVDVDGTWVTATDPSQVSRAVENVVVNAIRHARRSVRVAVRAGVVVVGDDGQGFALPFDEAVDPFRPGPASSARTTGTSGLGLYIARRSLEAVGGQIKLESSTSRGTTVLLYLGTAS